VSTRLGLGYSVAKKLLYVVRCVMIWLGSGTILFFVTQSAIV
jgi:hypothetical protein